MNENLPIYLKNLKKTKTEKTNLPVFVKDSKKYQGGYIIKYFYKPISQIINYDKERINE